MAEKDPSKLIEDMSESLQREFRESADRIEAAIGLHGRMISSGTIAIAGLHRAFGRHDRAIKDMQKRLRQLERGRRNGKPRR